MNNIRKYNNGSLLTHQQNGDKTQIDKYSTIDSSEAIRVEPSFNQERSNKAFDSYSNNYTHDTHDKEEIKRLTWKRDTRILPLVCLFYLFSFLDRVNIGNAKLAGIIEDTNMTENEFNDALSIFFVGYILFEIPANVILNKLGPRIWMSIMMATWGTIMMLMGAVKTGPQLIVARCFLGVAEAGLVPAIIFYISKWYTKREQARRVAIFYGVSTCAGAFGGILAYGLMLLDGVQGLDGWQWIFIIEAIPTLVLSIVCLFTLPEFPETTSFLSEHERKTVMDMISQDNGQYNNSGENVATFSKKQFLAVFKDWKTYLFSLAAICIIASVYSVSMFLPTIIHGLGFTALNAQAMSSIPWSIACIFTILNGISADKHGERGIHVVIGILSSMLGFILLISLKHVAGLFFATILTATGMYSALGVFIPWIANNFTGTTKRSVAIAAINSLGNCGGVIAGQLYRADDAPYYIHGHAACLGFQGGAVICAIILKLAFLRANKKRENMTQEERYKKIEKDNELCDKHPDFRYIS
ncbi:major facilitator superfamily domain-containing protein [Circinella umbellata]|nr:major facilitator superfamily domain-containing protein [Circinella umbellata]